MDVLYVCLHQKRLKKIVSACQPWHWKICWRGENGRSDEAASILVLQLCLQLLPNENTWCLSSLETMQGNLLTFLADVPPTLHLSKIRHPWLAEAPESSIWNNLLWIFHCSHSLERLFGTPNAYNYRKFWSRAHPARMQLYYLTDLRFTLDLKYCSYEYSFSRSLEWSSGNHNAHKLPKSRTLSIKVFFSPKAKEFKRRNEAGR